MNGSKQEVLIRLGLSLGQVLVEDMTCGRQKDKLKKGG